MGSNGANGSDDDDDEDDEPLGAIASIERLSEPASTDAGKRKKHKSSKNKKKKKKKASALKQSSPPRIPLDDLFPSGNYATGQLLKYDSPSESTARVKSSEARQKGRQDLEDSTFLEDYRKAAEVHRQTRRWVQESVKPGQTLTDIAVGIEDCVRALLGNDGLDPTTSLQAGLGFPTGLSLNHCVAHFTPNPGQTDTVLQYGDVMKVDFGVHINGWIVDSAFTMAFDPVYDNLLAAVKDATNSGIMVRLDRMLSLVAQVHEQ